MNENNLDNVLDAFELLLEAVEIEIDLIYEVGSKAFERHDHHTAREVAERANQATAFREKVLSLRKEWKVLEKTHVVNEEEIIPDPQSNSGQLQTKTHTDNKKKIIRNPQHNLDKLERGVRTPMEDYYQPILEALNETGGSGRMGDVLTRVEQLMRGKLRDVDYEPLPSDGILRWTKTAQWARWTMVKEGLLKSDSPRGVWEITDVGIALYNQRRVK